MGNYAKVINDEVIDVMVADSMFASSYEDPNGAELVQSVDDNGNVVRKNPAGIGFRLDRARNAFIPPQNFPSWILNEFSCLWEAPTPYPTDGKPYRWDEASLSWVEMVVQT